jgi:hypothetical protein
MTLNPRHKAAGISQSIATEITQDAYRRGYGDGIQAAIDAIGNGQTAGTLEKFLNDVIRKWQKAPKDRRIKAPAP